MPSYTNPAAQVSAFDTNSYNAYVLEDPRTQSIAQTIPTKQGQQKPKRSQSHMTLEIVKEQLQDEIESYKKMFENEDKKKHQQTKHMLKKLKHTQKKLAKHGLVNKDQNFLNNIFESSIDQIQMSDMIFVVEYICHQSNNILEHFDQ